ncbi:MAG: thermonuclease family protein [Gammaproteobacteria bacterium]|nr:thermonuclease family protein [Gammaproteobacteria bacterium]
MVKIYSSICVGALILAFVITPLFAETLTGWVSHIADGDTITVLDYSNQQHKIRLMGIDAPEKYQAFGNRSHQNLGALVNGRDVVVEWNKRDRYGRIIGKVLVAPHDSSCPNPRDCPKTLDVCLEQVRSGNAWWYKKYAKEQAPEDQSKYEQAEFEAKVHRNGLWTDTNPVPPWEFRREKN